MDVGRFPVYRLIEGRVMYQALRGDRWSPVDDAVVARMFRTFDGISPDVLGSEQSFALASAHPGSWRGAGTKKAYVKPEFGRRGVLSAVTVDTIGPVTGPTPSDISLKTDIENVGTPANGRPL